MQGARDRHTHYLASDRLDEAKRALAAEPQRIDFVQSEHAGEPGAKLILTNLPDIDRLFASDWLAASLAALEADSGAFSQPTLRTLCAKSPQPMTVSLWLLADGAPMASFAIRPVCHGLIFWP